MIAILNFSLGNLKSVLNGFYALGHKAIITNNRDEILDADGLVIPGVGAFKDGMDQLKKFGLIEVIKDAQYNGKPILGICLGLQLLFSESEEFGKHEGIGIFRGMIKGFSGLLKIPHMGWNTVRQKKDTPLLKGIKDEDFFYFVHSYYAIPDDNDIIVGETEYGITFPSIVQKDKIMATQFHPEKSSTAGLKILDNFAKIAISTGTR